MRRQMVAVLACGLTIVGACWADSSGLRNELERVFAETGISVSGAAGGARLSLERN